MMMIYSRTWKLLKTKICACLTMNKSSFVLSLCVARSLFALLVVLCFDQGCDHGQQHGDGDDQHRHRLHQAQLAVQGGQGAAGQLGRSLTHQVLVVLDVQVPDLLDLAEDTLQLAVADPGVEGHQELGVGGLQLQEGLEPDAAQLVPPQVQQSESPQRSQSVSLDRRDVVVGEQQQLQALLPGQNLVLQLLQPVALQAQEAQPGQAAQRTHLHGSDLVVAQVQVPQVLTVGQGAGAQPLQQVVVQTQLQEGGQTPTQVLRDQTQLVEAQVQSLQELKGGQRLKDRDETKHQSETTTLFTFTFTVPEHWF